MVSTKLHGFLSDRKEAAAGVLYNGGELSEFLECLNSRAGIIAA
jgi:hypothetical protein